MGSVKYTSNIIMGTNKKYRKCGQCKFYSVTVKNKKLLK